MRVLVVDDEAALRDGLVDALSAEGWDVEAAPNGQVALELLQQRPVDVAVIDLMMPIMDGAEFRARVRASEAFARLPIVLLSATDRPWAPGPGEAILPKPFHLDDLLATLDRVIRTVRAESL